MIFHSEAVVHYSPEKYNSKRISTLYNPRSNTAVYPLILPLPGVNIRLTISGIYDKIQCEKGDFHPTCDISFSGNTCPPPR